MKKNKAMAYAVAAIAFVLFNVIAFAIPTEKTVTFWIAYVFSVVAFASQIVIGEFAFKSGDTLKSKFLGISLIIVGIAYLLIQLIAFAVFMAFSSAPPWIAVIVCVLILGISSICLIGAKAGSEEINRLEVKVEKKVFSVKSLQIDVEILISTEADADTKAALVRLSDKLRFSDPMSSDALSELEQEIVQKVRELKAAENKAEIITALDHLISERNKKAKLLK